MKRVKFLSTAAGSYGLATEGEEKVINERLAGQLEKQGTVEVLGDVEDEEEEKAEGGVRIHDETSKEKVVEEETDPKDPTNEAKNKEKKSPAGPNAKKK